MDKIKKYIIALVLISATSIGAILFGILLIVSSPLIALFTKIDYKVKRKNNENKFRE